MYPQSYIHKTLQMTITKASLSQSNAAPKPSQAHLTYPVPQLFVSSAFPQPFAGQTINQSDGPEVNLHSFC